MTTVTDEQVAAPVEGRGQVEARRPARGADEVADLRSELHLHRSRLATALHRLQDAGFEVLNDVVINQVLVSFGRPEVTREVIRRVQEEGTCWCGGTVWQGKTAMRISVSSWATTETDVEHSLQAIIRIANECRPM